MSDSNLSPLSSPVSLEDLARHVNLAVGTVSRALNGNQRVNVDTRARVAAAARELGYEPSPLARGLRSGRTGLIGICFFMNSPSRNVQVTAQLYFLQKFLKEQGKRCLVEFSPWEYEHKVRAIEHFLAMRAEGIIHVGSFPEKLLQPLARLRERNIPYVLLDPHSPELPFSVALDRTLAYEKITDHLLDLGHTRLALLGIAPAFSVHHFTAYQARIQGVRRSLERRGLDFEQCVDICFDLPETLESAGEFGRRLAARFYPRLREATACLASNDDVALGAIEFLKTRGCRVPGDLSMVGFDDSARHGDPPLTTVNQQIDQSTSAAVAMLQAASVSGMTQTIPSRMIEPLLVVRDSTGPAGSR
ncbi:MAG TPA: LacI family DNA-binding transcriptional regulator [Chthoniobacteraceae bacterium]|nr:LacI family DNA-binding transcriptional regulator [Chthoniobacteraceae bacterium]